MYQIDKRTKEQFCAYLLERECAAATVAKYMHDLGLLAAFCGGEIGEKGTLIGFKQHLQEQGYAPSSVNSMLAAVNRFLTYIGRPDWKLRYLKAPRSTFCGKERELTRRDYERLVSAAKHAGDRRLELLVQTMCVTGIRVSEVRAVTVESLRCGQAEISSHRNIQKIPSEVSAKDSKQLDFCRGGILL